MYKQTRQRIAKGGFQLRSWVSNNSNVNEHFATEAITVIYILLLICIIINSTEIQIIQKYLNSGKLFHKYTVFKLSVYQSVLIPSSKILLSFTL